jgi:hypothetical protein
MNVNVWKHAVGAARIAAVFTLTGALLMSGGMTLAHSNRGMGGNAIEGTWFVHVTLRNCDTNAPLGSFNSLVTFHDGGTISETTSSPTFAIGQRSPGQGHWDFAGHRTFDQRMIGLINFDTAANLPGTPGFNPSLPITPGFYAGWSTVSHTLTLTDANHASSSGTNAFYKADGTLYRTGCSTAEATRFE